MRFGARHILTQVGMRGDAHDLEVDRARDFGNAPRMNRRTFLKTSAMLPALGAAVADSQQPEPSLRHSAFDPWVEVHAGRLRANAAAVHRFTRVPIVAVIKNNGYGAGLEHVARALEPAAHISGFAVVKLQEAMALRQAGVRKPVLLMGPVEEEDLTEIARRDITFMTYTPIRQALERAAARGGRPMRVHVCVDTGLGRVGVPYGRAPDLIRELAGARGVHVDGLMMTFSEDQAFDREQLRRFQTLVAQLERAGIRTGVKHAASSYTLFQHPDAFLDAVRTGMVLYGIYPEPSFRKTGALELVPAIALKTRVAYVKQLQARESAGYNRAYIAASAVWVATLPVGHADGLPRAAAKGGRVRINGRLFPIIASVSASHTIVEVGPEPVVAIGDEATLFDSTPGSRPEDLAQACGASVYDLTMHLNPLLPRRVIDG
jgi:alanine racemase